MLRDSTRWPAPLHAYLCVVRVMISLHCIVQPVRQVENHHAYTHLYTFQLVECRRAPKVGDCGAAARVITPTVPVPVLPPHNMVFGLTPLCSASIIFTNSFMAKAYMTFGWRLGNPDGEPGNATFENARKAQLNEAEWSPFLIGGLLCLHVKDGKTPIVAATLAAAGSIWYFWSRVLLCAKNGEPLVLPGGLARYFAGAMMVFQLMSTFSTHCPMLK